MPGPAAAPTFVEVIAEREALTRAPIRVRIGAAEIEVHTGFDAELLREVVDALGGRA